MKKLTLIVAILVFLLSCTTTYVVERQPTKPTGKSEEIKISAPSGEIQEVVADGVAAITATLDIARDQAIADALRKAVEQGVGTFINSETAVRNFTLLKDEIYSKARGYVSAYRILDETKESDVLRVKILAKVKLTEIENDLEAIGLLLQQKGRPRIMLVIKEYKGDNTIWEDWSEVETMLIEKFTEKGFPIVDATMVKRNLANEQVRAIMAGDDKTAAQLGLKLGAEIVITGQAILNEIEKTTPYTQNLRKFYQTKLNLRAIDTETAEILTATAVTKEVPFSQETAKKEAVAECSDKMVKAILDKWQSEENITQIYITGAKFSDIQKLKQGILEKIRGVTKVIQRDFTENRAILEVISKTSSQEIFSELGSKDLGIAFEIKGFSGNRIDMIIGGKDEK
ncbi:MAG: flagellar assembly protein T N-terminal domain-containing protein [candidate division WOR-3 bacterium]